MSNSWEWVERHARQEHRRKWLRRIGILLAACLLLFVFRVPSPDPDPNHVDTVNQGQHHASNQELGVGKPEKVAPIEPEANKDSVQATETEPIGQDSIQESPVIRAAESNHNIPYRPAPLPTDPEPAPKLLKDAERAIARLKQKIKRLNQNEDWLNKYGGRGWEEARSAMEEAQKSDDPQTVIELTEKASQFIDFSLPAMQYEEYLVKTRGKTPAEILQAQLRFRKKHPNHPDLPDIEASLAKLSHGHWMAMAIEQMQNASPDDSGFIEGWLPIAEAWQLVGNDAEAREAIRRARETLPRMAQVERIIESTIDLCQHESFDPTFSKQLINDAAKTCGQVASTSKRSRYFANLSGLAMTFGHRAIAAKLLKKSLALIDMSQGPNTANKAVFSQQFRAAAWTESPETIFATCRKLEKLNYPEPSINANGYAHAAMAAARHIDREQFLRAMFKAECYLARLSFVTYPNYLFAARLAEANILQRRWRAAVIIANNIPDPGVRASILFRVMKDAPQEVYSPHLPELFHRFGAQRWACSAVAGHAEHRVRSGESRLSLVAWSRTLPLASLRAAAYVGIASAAKFSSAGKDDSSSTNEPEPQRPEITDIDSLLDAAERTAAGVDDPLDSAFAWLQVARTSNLLRKTSRYRHAVAMVDNQILDAWKSVWDDRPPVKLSFNGGYYYANTSHKTNEKNTINMIVACHRHLAVMQSDMGDSKGAMETCLNLANAAGFRLATSTYYDMSFLQMEAIAIRVQSETGVGSDAFTPADDRAKSYARSIIAAWSDDIPTLKSQIDKLTKKSKRGQLARAYAELAILYAKRHNIDGYRTARRSALSQITQGNASSELKCVLATADAHAEEFTLAEANLVRGTVPWFGDANRSRSQLAMALAKDGQWKKAIEHADRIPAKYPVFRGDAWEAIAAARFKDEREPREQLLEWAGLLESPGDRVGAFCGLALAAQASRP